MRHQASVFAVFSVLSITLGACTASTEAPAGSAAEELRGQDLTASQEHTALELLDDVCGDTWCEGDYDWTFAKLRCAFADSACTLTVKLTDPGDDTQPAREFWRSCHLDGLSSYGDIVQTSNGYKSLVDGFYDKVDQCAERLENDVPPR